MREPLLLVAVKMQKKTFIFMSLSECSLPPVPPLPPPLFPFLSDEHVVVRGAF